MQPLVGNAAHLPGDCYPTRPLHKEPVLLLSIDPGLTTGVAVLNYRGEVIFATELFGDPDLIARTCAGISHQDEVIEEGPANRNNPYLDDLDGRLREQFPEATWMRPADWKPTPRASTPIPRRTIQSVHVRDAIWMGREFLHRSGHHLDTQAMAS